jgi:hypothetical protein
MADLSRVFALRGQNSFISIKFVRFSTYLNGKIINCCKRSLKAYIFAQAAEIKLTGSASWRKGKFCVNYPHTGQVVRMVGDFVCSKTVSTKNGKIMKFDAFLDKQGVFSIRSTFLPPCNPFHSMATESI